MHELTRLAMTFAACLAATAAVAVCFRIGGKKISLPNVVAIPVGITVAEAVRQQWPMSDAAFPFVLAGLVGAAVGCAQYAKARRLTTQSGGRIARN